MLHILFPPTNLLGGKIEQALSTLKAIIPLPQGM
jgi:hypothetical protein